MANANLALISALRDTALRLNNGNHYAWGHHGSCNCGNLLQTVTALTKEEILTYAHTGTGEWTELAVDYCGVTGAPIDLLIKKLQELGLTPTDIHNIEYLEDKAVLHKLAGGFRWLQRNQRQDVVDYFYAYANLLEEQLIAETPVNFEALLPKINFEIVPTEKFQLV
jgi:hypothetical protein